MIYLELFLTFLKLGAFTFGGGAAMMPFIQQEAVDKWDFEAEEIINFIAISESTPGPTFGLVIPSFIIILIIARCYDKFKTNKIVAGAMTGLRPASVGLIAAATVSIGIEVFFGGSFALSAMLSYDFIAAFLLFAAMLALCLFKKKTSPVVVIGISAILGIGICYLGELFAR